MAEKIGNLLRRLEGLWEKKGTAWLLWCLFFCWGLWWIRQIPGTGKSVALLAVVAALMSTFWSNLDTTAKFMWVLLMFGFLFIESRAIDKDRIESATELANYFSTISQQSSSDLKQILDQERQDFQSSFDTQQQAIKQQQDQFTKTIQTLVDTHSEDEKNFAGVLNKQDKAFEAQRELSEQLMGRLVPGDSPTPTNACSTIYQPKDGEVLVINGDSADITGAFPHTVLMIGGFPVLSVDRVANSSEDLSLSVDIRDHGCPVKVMFLSRNRYKTGTL
jgi:hypothetical protein